MKKLIPLFVLLAAATAGGASGFFLKTAGGSTTGVVTEEGHDKSKTGFSSAAEASKTSDDLSAHSKNSSMSGHKEAKTVTTYMKFSRQFIAPVVRSGRPVAMMVMDVNIELDPASADKAYAEEPKLRDAVLKVLLRQASDGRLAGIFSRPEILEVTKAEILEELQPILGDDAKSVLIMDLGYQEY